VQTKFTCKQKISFTLVTWLSIINIGLSQTIELYIPDIFHHEYAPAKTCYIDINQDTILEIVKNQNYTRLDYYSDGRLRAKYEVNTTMRIDTSSIYDPIKNIATLRVDSSLTISPNGKVQIFHEHNILPISKARLKAEGIASKNKMLGKYYYYPKHHDLKIVAQFNEFGDLNGTYKEYYGMEGKYELLKCEGQYGYMEKTVRIFSYDSYKYQFKKQKEASKIGEWKYYDLHGQLEGTEVFKWQH